MKKLIVLLIFYPLASHAIDVDSLVSHIAERSPSALRARAEMEAAKASNQTGTTLSDPSVEFNYLWGSPRDVGQRKDISITQSLDYATLSGRKQKEVKARNVMADAEYKLSMLNLQKSALLLLIDIAAANERHDLNCQRMALAERLAAGYARKMKAGDATKLEVNKAELNLATVRAEAMEDDIERQELLNSPLITTSLTADERTQLLTLRTDDVQTAMDRMCNEATISRALNDIANSSVAVSQAELGTARSANIPELTAGYMAELTRDEQFRGITLGLNIPLWSNRKRVARAKAQLTASVLAQAEREAETSAQRRQAEQRVAAMAEMRSSIANGIATTSPAELLDKALAGGGISIIDYLLELNDAFALKSKYIDVTQKYLSARAELF